MAPEVADERRRVGRGQVSPQPEGFYAPEAVRDEPGLAVEFFGEDGRRAVYSFKQLPCPGLHADLAAAWARRIGPSGGLRVRAAADTSWSAVARLLRWLGGLGQPPRTLGGLTLSQLRRFDQHRRMTSKGVSVVMEMTQIRGLLKEVEPQTLLRPDVREYLERPGQLHGRWKELRQRPQVPGYSDREFATIMAAARKDVVEIRRRHRASRTLIDRFEAASQDLDDKSREHAATLAAMLESGDVPAPMRAGLGGGDVPDLTAQRDLAGEVFLTTQDVLPLLVLGVGLSGRNSETIKELSWDHRLLEERAVAVNLLKRRRGKAHNRETIHWEVGSGSSRLNTPGGWFLLLHELAVSSRAFSRSERVWSIWTGDFGGSEESRAARRETRGHIDPFGIRLGRQLGMNKWVARHRLTADSPAGEEEGNGPRPLVLTLGRLKKTVEVRTTRAVGGHLPSASRTNTNDTCAAAGSAAG